MSTIYFGGSILPATGTGVLAYTAQTNLDSLDAQDFNIAFHEWVTQCWLHDEPVPNDAQSLAAFDLNELIPKFRREFAAGSWRRMRAGRGATAEEYVLFLQLMNRIPVVLVLNSKQPQQPLGRVRHKIIMSEIGIASGIINHLGMELKEGIPDIDRSLAIMLYDGRVGHVITARNVDERSRDWISYDDPTWPGGKSMLSEGENAQNTRAWYLGNPEIGTWVTNLVYLSSLTFGIPLSQSMAKTWVEWAKDAEEQFREQYRSLFGDDPPL